MELFNSLFECFCVKCNNKTDNEILVDSLQNPSKNSENLPNSKLFIRRSSDEIRQFLEDIKNEPGMKEILSKDVKPIFSKYPYPPSSDPFKYASKDLIERYEKENNVKIVRTND